MDKDLLERLIVENQSDRITDLLNNNNGLARELTSQGISPIILASFYNRPEIAKIIASYCTNLNIYEAIAIGDQEIVLNLLLENPGLVNEFSNDGFPPLVLASLFGFFNLVDTLISNGANLELPTENGFVVYPLHAACAGNHLKVVQLLLQNGAKPNVVQSSGLTPLHIAAEYGNIEMIIELLENGALTHFKMENGKTASQLAKEKGHVEISEILSN
ncbi:ankyrin repeat domain-containing protein [Pedobacter flavus]|uniref:Ankyrin repeat domain-containing protein n=1 Tax=Pedobacter flavus TaxID=3113906 RepID=A0ABU7H3G8_9SPHI|nr:ankyrin repeat domain-containing protein [Pedobacter sp. VNH31]MEE1885883.1 ankyrin repeat domain-containing protein [Pedobacter sp. VNH31]